MFRTERLDRELELTGWRRTADARFTDRHGRVLWMLGPPVRRTWSSTGCLTDERSVPYVVEDTAGGVRVRADAACELDLAEMPAEVAAAMVDDRSAALTVIGSFEPLARPSDLARFFRGTAVLDTHDFGGRRCPSEQTALSIYRIARLRGGPFWDAVAEATATSVSRRITDAPDGMPAHDLMGAQESHTRFLADAALLLLAAGRTEQARTSLAALEQLAVPFAGGLWYVHDTAERSAGANHLVINSHLHTLLVLMAFERPLAAGRAALDAALALRGEHRRWVLAALLGASELLRSRGRGHGLAHRSQVMAARSRGRRPHLRLPGGWLARDAGLPPAPSYVAVNLHDLAALERNGPTSRSSAALRSGVRWASRTGYFRAQRRDGDPLAVLQPVALRNAGHVDDARRAADALAGAGYAPAVGWPGFEDALWPRLARGTP